MKISTRFLVSFGLLIILGVSCQSFNKVIETATPETSINWWTLWLAQPVCQPPCWQDITPGVTTMGEALSILKNTPELKITFRSEYGADWAFNGNKDEGGSLSISQDKVVRVIWLGSSSDRKLYIETIVTSHNYPKYVKPYDCREGMCSTALVYPDLGMFLSVFIKNTGKINDIPQIEILPDTVVDRVYFIEQGIESFQKSLRLKESDLLMDWKGYGVYP